VGLGVLYSYMVGFVIEGQAVQPAPGQSKPQYDLASRDARIDREACPLAYALGAEMFTAHDTRFHDGVSLIVKGMAAQLAPLPGRGLTQPASAETMD
jgi:TetR/AcrR family transcriptional regulator, tetracycline repressor protein